jgi:hypothetical protein
MANRNNRKSGNNRRAQTPKVGNRAYIDAMMEIRRSSAASPIPSGTAYKRRPKHKEW